MVQLLPLWRLVLVLDILAFLVMKIVLALMAYLETAKLHDNVYIKIHVISCIKNTMSHFVTTFKKLNIFFLFKSNFDGS